MLQPALAQSWVAHLPSSCISACCAHIIFIPVAQEFCKTHPEVARVTATPRIPTYDKETMSLTLVVCVHVCESA
jgi:hypothetical protein